MSPNPTQVLIAGAGVAGLETLLALSDLARGRVHVTLLAPEPDFVYRPLQTAEPFSLGHQTRRPLSSVAEEHHADLVADGLAEVLPDTRQVRCTSGAMLTFDMLVIALGAVAEPVEHATTFSGDQAREMMGGILADLEQSYSRSVAFVALQEGWTLPLYELAILTAREVSAMGMDDVRVSIVSPEGRPLDLFGDEASTAVGALLDGERIDFLGSTTAELRHGVVILGAGGERLEADRIVSLPRLRGPAVAGLPTDAGGFIAVDPYGRVKGVDDVYAAGDATDYPIKQGGLATQQADAVAETIAERAGAGGRPKPFRPVLRGLLLTGGRDDRFLVRPGIGAHADDGMSGERPLWWPPTKVTGRYIAPYLFGGSDRDLLAPGGHASRLDVEIALPTP